MPSPAAQAPLTPSLRAELRPERARDRAAIVCLLLLTAATRWPLLGNYAGEPDSGLFIEGVWRWLSYGPRVAEIYGKNLSAGYYWSLAALLHLLHTDPTHFPLVMNRLSFAAALATAPLAYLLARRLLSPLPAFCASLIFLFQPSLWWLGIEPHPQGPAIALFLASAWLFLRAWGVPLYPAQIPLGPRPHLGWTAAMIITLAAALLLRADQVLMFLAFPSLLWAAVHWPRALEGASSQGTLKAPLWRPRAWLGPMIAIALPLCAASLLFLFLRQAMLQTPFAATQAYSRQQTSGYILHGLQLLGHRPVYFVQQLLPMATSIGMLAALLAGLALGLGFKRWGWRWAGPGIMLWAGWSAASYLFWFLVLGNNIRHVALLALPLLWAACDAGRRWLPPAALLSACTAIVLLDPWIIPASSNVTLYASANVPASWRDLHQRQAELSAIAARMISTPPASATPACFLGSYTTPYVLSDVLMQTNRLASSSVVGMRVGPGWSDVWLQGPTGWRRLRFYEMYSEREYRGLRPGCASAFSVEYSAAGLHQRYMGKEWRNTPLLSAYYPSRPNSSTPRRNKKR